MFRVEGILDLDGDILDTDGINRRGIDDLRTEVTEFHGLHIREFVDGIGGLDDFRIGGHEAINVCPYLEDICVKGCCDNCCGIVAATTTKIGGLVAVAVAGNEARYYGNCLAGVTIIGLESSKGFLHQFVGQFGIEHMFAFLVSRADEVTAVHAHAILNHGGDNMRRQALTIRNNGVLCLLAQVVNQEYTIIDAPQLVEELINVVE